MTTLYHLIRTRDGAYWRPKGEGYTYKVSEAGTFDGPLARSVVENTHGDVEMIEVQPDEGSFILSDNLESALVFAIETLVHAESLNGPGFGSSKRASLEANLAYLRKHRTLEVRA